MRESFTKISNGDFDVSNKFRDKVKGEIKNQLKAYKRDFVGNDEDILSVALMKPVELADLVIKVESILFSACRIMQNDKVVLTIEDISYGMASPKFPHHEIYSEKSKRLEFFTRFNFAKSWGLPSLIVSDLMHYFQLKSILTPGYLYFSLRNGYIVDESIVNSTILMEDSVIGLDRYSISEDCECDKIDRRSVYFSIIDSKIKHNDNLENYLPSNEDMSKWDEDNNSRKIVVKSKGLAFKDGDSDNEVVSLKTNYNVLLTDEFKKLQGKISLGRQQLNTVSKSKRPIHIDLNELREYVVIMDKLDENSNWLDRYEVIKFFDTFENKNVSSISIKDINHWIGLPNVGKTTIMTILAGYLSNKGMKVGLVLRDNSDVDGVTDSLIKCGVKALPFIGNELDNYFKNRLSKLDSVEDMINDNVIEFYEDTCILKDSLDLSIENMEDIKRENLCYSVCFKDTKYYKNNRQVSSCSREMVCPYIMECPKYKTRHLFGESSVYLTNIQSLIMTQTPKVVFKEQVTSLELLVKECDVIFIDEADDMQEKIDSLFINEEFVAEGKEKGMLRLTMEHIEEEVDGRKAGYRAVTDWLNAARHTTAAAEEILHLLSEGVLPKARMRSSFTSRSIFRLLAYKMVEGVGFTNDDEDGDSEETLLKIDETKKEIVEFYNNFLNKFYQVYEGKESIFSIEDEYISKMLQTVNYMMGVGKSYFYEACEICFNMVVDKFDIVVNLDTDSDKKRVNSYIKMFQLILATSVFEVCYNYTQLNIDRCKPFISDENIKKNIGYGNSYVRHYEGLIPKTSAGAQYGLKYVEEGGRRSLRLSKYESVGRYLLYNLGNLFGDIDGVVTSKTVLMSATSYMPYSTNYHIDITPDYILENSDVSNLSVKYKKLFLTDKNEEVIKLSGCAEKNKDKIISEIAEDLARVTYSGKSKLDKIFETTTKGRERVALTVGSFEEARMLYIHLQRELAINGYANKIKMCVITNSSSIYKDSNINLFLKSNLYKFHESDYNLAIIVTKSLERGVNILTEDEFGKMVAAFSTLVYIKRPYIIPQNMVDLVCILNENAIKSYNMSYEDAVKLCGGEYSVSNFARKVINSTHKLQDKFYNRTFYSYIEDDYDRLSIIANLLVSSHQLEGRFYRGNVPATIIYADGAFFPKESKGERQEESYKTSIVEGFKWYFNHFKDDTSIDGVKIYNIMKKLYGFRIDALNDITYL